MTNQGLNKAVAEAMGWRDVGFYPDGLRGREPGCTTDYKACVPNWAEDLPLAMRDLWPWLVEQVKPYGGNIRLEATIMPPQSDSEVVDTYQCVAITYLDYFESEGVGENGGYAICEAVLAVAEKLEE